MLLVGIGWNRLGVVMDILIYGTDVNFSGLEDLDPDIHLDVVGAGPPPVPPLVIMLRRGDKVEPIRRDQLRERLGKSDPELLLAVRLEDLDPDIHLDVVGAGPPPAPPVVIMLRRGDKVEPVGQDELRERLGMSDRELPLAVRQEGTSTVHVPDFTALIADARSQGRSLAIEVSP